MTSSNEVLLVLHHLVDFTLHFRGTAYHLNTFAACTQSTVLNDAIATLTNDDWTSICELTERCQMPGHRCLTVADNGELSSSSNRTIYQIINPIEADDFYSFLKLIVDPSALLRSTHTWSLPAWRASLKAGDQVRFAKLGQDNTLAYRSAEVIARRGEFFEVKHQSHASSSGCKVSNVHWHLIYRTGCIPPARDERLDTFLKKHARSFKLAIQFKCESLLTCFEKRFNQMLSVDLPSPKPRVFEGLWHLIGLIDQLDHGEWPAMKQAVMDALSLDDQPDKRAAYQTVFGSCLTVNTRAKMLSDRTVTEASKMEKNAEDVTNIATPIVPTMLPPRAHAYQVPQFSPASHSNDSRFDRLSTIVDICL